MKQGWEIKKLGDVGTFQRGGGFLKSDFVEDGYPCVHYGQIHTKFGVKTYNHLTCISEELALSKSKIANSGDIIIAITSEDVEGSCKCTAWLGDYDVAVGGHAAIFKHGLNPAFVAYYFRGPYFNTAKKVYAHGSKVVEIRPADIATINISYPSLSEQEKIVAELDCLSGIIEKKQQQLKELDNLAQSIFYEMFGDPVENDKGWEVKRLGDLADISSSKRIFANEYTETGVPFYRGKEVTEKSKGNEISVELFISEDRYNEIKRIYGVPVVGDILVTAVGTIGNIWVVDSEEPFYFKDGNVLWMKIKNNSHPVYFKYLLSVLIDEYKGQMANGCAYSALTIVNLKEMPTTIVPLSLQQDFASKIEAIEKQKELIAQSIKEAETLLGSRMDYYFN